MSVEDETRRAVDAARAEGALTDLDSGVVETLMHIAREID